MALLDKLSFDNRFRQLPERFFALQNPTAVAAPVLMAFNAPLGQTLGIDRANCTDAELAETFSGNRLLPGSEPLSAAYAGHQFGHWAGTLGDGRAILLGEITSTSGERWDVQLKGSGRTPFSRGGDGRAWLGPVIREYLVSNTMPLLNIPSTTALAVVATGEHVWREQGPLPGAILTRIARSHVRVGSFQYLAANKDTDGLRLLVNHMIEHHYPSLVNAQNKPLALLSAVIERQADLIARWQAHGFIHGVMNTDNASIVGDTIDYGPCAFMDEFDNAKVFSSIDQHGRYAYQNQPSIGHWNMSMLAQSLLPILHLEAEKENDDEAIALAQAALDRFPALFAECYRQHMLAKLGLFDNTSGEDLVFIEQLLALMQADHIDFTVCFRALSDPSSARFLALFKSEPAALDWYSRWQERLGGQHDAARMQATNPGIIPRNHWIEATIQAALQNDWSLFERFAQALEQPFQEHPEFSVPPQAQERVQATFCGT